MSYPQAFVQQIEAIFQDNDQVKMALQSGNSAVLCNALDERTLALRQLLGANPQTLEPDALQESGMVFQQIQELVKLSRQLERITKKSSAMTL